MDDKWFKQQQKKVGVTAEDIANEMGRTRSVVSHIYTGQQKMSLEWAKAFAKVLQVPLDEVLKKAGVLGAEAERPPVRGFSDGDARPWTGKPGAREDVDQKARAFGGGKAGIDVWTVSTEVMSLGGYLSGDYILVDTHQSERCRAGDIVIAQKYDWQTGSATTLLRRYEPPVLVSASASVREQRVTVVDGQNVVIKGKVIASWRGG
ncbi:helix-turn-helix domain-containing protein [Roseobacter sp. YSTF-M11]|uniref:Helix-turn-helix domain-containing protein n=1 Tax=Roseobacter insulae TaxID=2859783 RepID=A0A9X1G006_9RHOB|nr:helix-turn-helix transcriptional regulator [Roseobacter insulae]MBW4710711.1 helix-turn-helix domain-containing protein [Roseobacter insulae]